MEVAPRIVGDTEVCELLRTSNARDFGLGEQLAYMEELQRIAEMEELVEREKFDFYDEQVAESMEELVEGLEGIML